MARQVDRNTERIDTHAAIIADLAARMSITETQAQKLWEQMGRNEENAQKRHSEVLDAIHALRTDGEVLSTKFEIRSRMAGKILGAIALITAAGWAAWQLLSALSNYLQGVGA